ncbi:cryptochrome DASH-like [Oncorhynchus masou masou]|uniref:cryptochrome DASH-like n=1 Tax=Oncorhynchus masou masou TaxID=90313 RepID=UPI00318407E6
MSSLLFYNVENTKIKKPLNDLVSKLLTGTVCVCSVGYCDTAGMCLMQDAVATYKETRNGLIGLDYSTKFSPWLAIGCISPRYIYQQIKKYESERTANQSTYWVVFELLWRDYFKFVGAKYGDRLFDIKGLQDKSIPWKKDMNLFNAWKEGRTGVPFVDANMRELALTGFMSNRGRQNVASFLTKDLGLDWRMGAEWFHYLLVRLLARVSVRVGTWVRTWD